ncbi:hypothetical protein J0J30_23420, partial [Vibrio vulnificus]|nr:hypothetical protein [Vibrio vulnificus]
TRSGGVIGEQRVLEEEHLLTYYSQASGYHNPQFQVERHETKVQGEGVIDHRKKGEQFQEVVESTYKEVTFKASTKKAKSDNQSTTSTKDIV